MSLSPLDMRDVAILPSAGSKPQEEKIQTFGPVIFRSPVLIHYWAVCCTCQDVVQEKEGGDES